MPPRAPRARRGNALKQKTAAEENVESAPTRATAPMVSPKAVGSTARGDAPVAEKMPPTTATDAPAEGDARALLEKELADLDSELEIRCEALRQIAAACEAQMREEVKTQLAKIPKKVRAMTLKQFSEDYRSEISAELLKDVEARLRAATAAAAAAAAAAGKENAPAPAPTRKRGRPTNASIAAAKAAKKEAAEKERERERQIEEAANQELSPNVSTRGGEMPPPPPMFAAPYSGGASDAARKTARTAAAAIATGTGTLLAATPDRAKRRGAFANAAADGGSSFAVPCTPVDGRGGGAAVAAPQMPRMSVAKTPATLRRARKGEVLYSANGSPLGAADDGEGSDDDGAGAGADASKRALASAVKRVRFSTGGDGGGGGGDGDGGGAGAAHGRKASIVAMRGASEGGERSALVVTTDDGTEIDLGAVDASNGGETVDAAVGALQSLQAQVAAAMARLTGK